MLSPYFSTSREPMPGLPRSCGAGTAFASCLGFVNEEEMPCLQWGR